MRKTSFRTLLAVLLCASLLLGPAVTAFAETAVVTGSEVNVRSGPGQDYAILGSYSRNSTVEVIDRSNADWYAVNFYGEVGYMSSGYLSLQTESQTAVVVPTPASGQGILITGGQEVYSGTVQSSQTSGQITGMYVRFRSGPSSDSGILGEYSRGKALTILGTDGDWTLCLIDGTYGYIYSQYVQADATPATPVPAQVPVQTPAPTAYPSGIIIEQGSAARTPVPTQTPINGQSIIFDFTGAPLQTPAPSPTPGAVPVQTPAPTAPAPAAGSTPGTITGDYVRFRRGPGTDFSIIRSYDRGQVLTILGVEGDWTRCSIEGETGYVFSSYVRAASAAAQTPAATPDPGYSSGIGQVLNGGGAVIQAPAVTAAPTPTAAVDQTVTGSGTPGYIKGNNVRLRSAPDVSSEILSELYYGNSVEILGTDGIWTAIIHEGRAGYVYSQYVASGSFQSVSSGGSATGRQIADYALQLVGTPYSWGGVDPSTGFDCSGFVYYVYKHFGYSLNRIASEQALNGKHTEAADLQPGDLICFYSGGSYIGHVGIYIGDNRFVHAATSTTGVITSELTGYYANRGFEVRRIV